MTTTQKTMNFAKYFSTDLVNGPGVRATLFVTGCSHGCKGCFNSGIWNPNTGLPFTQEMEDTIIADLQDEVVARSGLSLLGGDPLFRKNLPAIIKLIKRVKAETTKTVWLWTGYTMAELQADDSFLEVLESCDVIIDGRFELAKADTSLKFRGSSNQQIWKKDEDAGLCAFIRSI